VSSSPATAEQAEAVKPATEQSHPPVGDREGKEPGRGPTTPQQRSRGTGRVAERRGESSEEGGEVVDDVAKDAGRVGEARAACSGCRSLQQCRKVR